MSRVLIIVIGVVVALALIGGSFWEGMNMGKAQAQSEQQAFFASRGGNANGTSGGGGFVGGFGGGGAFDPNAQGGTAAGRGAAQRGATGTISKVDGTTLTVTTNQGDTVTVTITDNTPIVKSVTGTASDLAVGTHVLVVGERSGNNVAATGVQITDRPTGTENLFGRPQATPTPATK
jgi:hypothetical protein